MIIVSLDVRIGNVFVLTCDSSAYVQLALSSVMLFVRAIRSPPSPPPPHQVRRCLYAYDSCDYPKRPIRQQRHSRPDRIAFYLYDRDDANDKLYDKWKLPETTHMTETTMCKPGLTCHWRPLCRRDRTQFHRGDRVAAVVWVVLENRMSVFIWSSQSDARQVRQRRLDGNLALYKKVETARDDYMQTRLNAGFFFTHGTTRRL